MILLPPRSTHTVTLFPYTTLVRSVGAAVHIVVVDVRDRLARCVVFVGVEGVVVFAAADIPALEEGGEGLGGIAGAHRPGPMRHAEHAGAAAAWGADRKSTRLNSSH